MSTKNTLNKFWISAVFFLVLTLFSFSQVKENNSAKETRTNQLQIPHLEKQGSATRLIVEGKPLLLISGELHNSTCGGFD
jgi:hypothetical protein